VSAADLIVPLIRDRAVVAGSLPPGGRDLDLLVRPADADSIAAGLGGAGFERRGRVWARFEECRADVVELVPAGSLGLEPPELEAVFEQAVPIEPTGRLCRPAPPHALLMLARRMMREGPNPLQKRLERIETEVAEDPEAFARAADRAPAWGAQVSLPALERAFRSGASIPLARRRRAIATELRRSRGRAGAWVGAWRAVLRRPRRGSVIALSGLDGCGKSSQAEQLAEALERLGFDAVVVWTSVAFHPPWLGRLARTLKRRLAAVAPRSGWAPASELEPGAPRGSDDPVKALRRRSRILTFAWSTLVTALLAAEVVRKVWAPLLRGRVVVCDRYLLDAWTHLLYQYGEDRRYPFQLALLRLAFPRPRIGYLFEVRPETAAARKGEYTAEQNARRAAIYREKGEELGTRVVDAERPMPEICAEVAGASWSALC